MAPGAGEAQSYRARLLGADAPARRAVADPCAHLSSLSPEATWRHHLRQEPDAVIPLVRIRGGGYEQSSSLLRLRFAHRARAALRAIDLVGVQSGLILAHPIDPQPIAPRDLLR